MPSPINPAWIIDCAIVLIFVSPKLYPGAFVDSPTLKAVREYGKYLGNAIISPADNANVSAAGAGREVLLEIGGGYKRN
jgi:hypothetical protein